jgi:DNA-binding GntR family transcriptional regulator
MNKDTSTATGGRQRELVSSAQDAYEILRRAFVLCEIAPGSWVTEVSLAEKYSLGRAAVRAALARLSHQEWIEASARKGYLVRPLTLKDIRDLFGVRTLLEPAAAEMAAKYATETELAEIARLARAAKYKEFDYESIRQFLDTNTRFHIVVATASRNRKLVRMLAEVLDESDRMFHFSLMMKNYSLEMFHKHTALVDALCSRDSTAARAAELEQLKNAEQMVVDAFLVENPIFDNINLAQGIAG